MSFPADRNAEQASVSTASEPAASRSALRGLTFRRLYTDGVTMDPRRAHAVESELRALLS